MVNENDFPSYIGFGRLKPETISEIKGMVTAEYFFDDKPVHRISHNMNSKNWIVKDIFNDTGMISSSTELKNAVLMHFNNLDCNTNSIFNYMRDKVCNRGNIYFENLSSLKDESGAASYFPAGRLVIIRLPIFFDGAGRHKVDILTNKIPYLEEEKRPLLKLCEAYNTSILLTKKNDGKLIIPILMLEYIVTLVSVFDVVDWICDNNLISKEKLYRMIIQDSKLKYQHSFQTFVGNANDDNSFFTILFKGLDNDKIKFEDFEKEMAASFNNKL